MTTVVHELLKTFDQLTDLEQMELASEILKRVIDLDFPPLSDQDLVFNAEELFLELDRQESAHE